MSFSAAQMDPDRIRMGERLKNIGILGAGGLSYFFGFFLTYTWFQKLWIDWSAGPTLLRASSRAISRDGLDDASNVSCLRARSGNLQKQQTWHGGLFGTAQEKQPRKSPLDSVDSQHSRLISLLSCGMIAWPRGLERSVQPTLARSASQASGDLAGPGLPSCARLA